MFGRKGHTSAACRRACGGGPLSRCARRGGARMAGRLDRWRSSELWVAHGEGGWSDLGERDLGGEESSGFLSSVRRVDDGLVFVPAGWCSMGDLRCSGEELGGLCSRFVRCAQLSSGGVRAGGLAALAAPLVGTRGQAGLGSSVRVDRQ